MYCILQLILGALPWDIYWKEKKKSLLKSKSTDREHDKKYDEICYQLKKWKGKDLFMHFGIYEEYKEYCEIYEYLQKLEPAEDPDWDFIDVSFLYSKEFYSC